MDQMELKVSKREVLGKKVRHLRSQGITPVHLFGHGIESLSLQCNTGELERALGQAGQTRLINLKLAKEKKPRTAVVREFDRDWRKGELLHVDFYQVKMEEEIKLEVPVILVGEAPALKSKANMLEHGLKTLTIQCLPTRIPAGLEVDISSLAEPGQAIRVKDIAVGKDITVLNDAELVVVKVIVRRVEKIEEVVREEPVEVAQEAVEVSEEATLAEKKPKET